MHRRSRSHFRAASPLQHLNGIALDLAWAPSRARDQHRQLATAEADRLRLAAAAVPRPKAPSFTRQGNRASAQTLSARGSSEFDVVAAADTALSIPRPSAPLRASRPALTENEPEATGGRPEIIFVVGTAAAGNEALASEFESKGGYKVCARMI